MDDVVINVRQIAQYPRVDAAIPGTVALMQLGEIGSPYASILASDFVSSALAASGSLILSAASGSIIFGSDQGTNAGVISMVSGEFLFSAPVSTSTVIASFIRADGVLVNGVPVATSADLVADRAASVTSFNFRTGDVLLEEGDILRAGGAPQANPRFSGWVTAPSHWDVRTNDDTVATANWVHRVLHSGCYSVSSFNGRRGCVTLQTSDVNQAYAVPGPPFPTSQNPPMGDASNRIATTLFVDESLQDLYLTISNEQLALLTSTYAPINSPQLTGIPTAPTANPGTSTGQLATTSFVMHAVTAGTAGVSSFNTRTGAVLLNTADITSAGGALLASPVFTGNPLAPTAAPGTSNTQLATTAFVAAAVGVAGGVTSFNTRTGAVVLTLADVSGTGVLANTPLTGVPTAPTAAPGTSTTQIATTAFVAASAAAGVTSFMSRTGAITLTAADVSAAGGALNASPAFTGTPTAPTPAPGDNSTTLATTAFVTAALAATGVTSFNGRAGAVTLTGTDITNAGGALLASPTFTGTPAAPTATVGTNTTQLATTAFVAAVLASGVTPGWTFSAGGGASQMSATGTSNSTFKVAAAPGNTLTFLNGNSGNLFCLLDATSNSNALTLNYPVFKNNLTGGSIVLTVGGSDTNRNIQFVPVGTGTVQAPTMAVGNNSTAIATTAFVHSAVGAVTLRSYLAGLTLSTAGSSATFSVAAGVADVGNGTALMTLASAMSKTTAAWAAGTSNGSLDTGAIANATWYHVFLIGQTGGTTDVLISLSATAPAVPGAYSYFRRIGAMRTNASGQWVLFHQLGDEFLWDVPVGDVAVTNLGTTATLYALSVPPGIQVISRIRAAASATTATGATMLINSPDEAAGASNSPAGNYTFQISTNNIGYPHALDVRTNTSSQIRAVATAASQSLNVATYGWIDRRGRDA